MRLHIIVSRSWTRFVTTLATSTVIIAAIAVPLSASDVGTAGAQGSNRGSDQVSSPNAYALQGDVTNPTGSGQTNFSSTGGGWRFESSSSLFTAVIGENTSGVGTANGVGGYTANGYGVYGNSTTGVGVYGFSADGDGVWGKASATTKAGVHGENTGNGSGVYGSSPGGTGVYGTSAGGVALFGDNTGTGSGFYGYSSGGPGGVMGSNTTEGARFYTRNASSYALVTGGLPNTYGNVYITGNYQATGTKSARVETSQGPRLMYASESTKNIFTDQGSATLVNGRAVITIDSLYAQTVNLKEHYQIFVTPRSFDTPGLGVGNVTETGFEVRELNGGHGNFSFDWRIDGLRKGYEKDRLEDAGPAPASGGKAYEMPAVPQPAAKP